MTTVSHTAVVEWCNNSCKEKNPPKIVPVPVATSYKKRVLEAALPTNKRIKIR